jgi:hypothetical protein
VPFIRCTTWSPAPAVTGVAAPDKLTEPPARVTELPLALVTVIVPGRVDVTVSPPRSLDMADLVTPLDMFTTPFVLPGALRCESPLLANDVGF